MTQKQRITSIFADTIFEMRLFFNFYSSFSLSVFHSVSLALFLYLFRHHFSFLFLFLSFFLNLFRISELIYLLCFVLQISCSLFNLIKTSLFLKVPCQSGNLVLLFSLSFSLSLSLSFFLSFSFSIFAHTHLFLLPHISF